MDNRKVELFDKALDQLMGDMDDLEGKGAMAHSTEECPDPLNCKDHEIESGENLTPGEPSLKIEVHKLGMPSLDGAKESEGEGLSAEEAEELKKLLK